MGKILPLRKGLIVGIILLIISTEAIAATAQTIEKPCQSTSRETWLYVGGSGPGNYSRIQDAINASSDGNTVFVYNGTYHEHLSITKAIDLVGQERESTIIDGEGNDSVVIIIANVTIRGFTIQHSGNASYDAGIKNFNPPNTPCRFTIAGNRIIDNTNGIVIQGSQEDTIMNNEIVNNDLGISLLLTSRCTIKGNTFINNTKHASFEYLFFLQLFPRDTWNENYWDDWHSSLPRPIKGVKELVYLILRPGMIYTIPIPWISFDWHPSENPNDMREDVKQMAAYHTNM